MPNRRHPILDWIISTLLLLIAHFPSPSYQLIKSGGRIWVSPSEFDFLASRLSFDKTVFKIKYCDISVSHTGWLRFMDCTDSTKFCSIIENHYQSLDKEINFPYKSVEAAEATLRWCDKFVAELELCPWAKLSLSRPGAIRLKILHHPVVSTSESHEDLKYYEAITRLAASELLFATDRSPGGSRPRELRLPGYDSFNLEDLTTLEGPPKTDPKLAITFIVMAPSLVPLENNQRKNILWKRKNTQGRNSLKESPGGIMPFLDFYNFVLDLQAALFAEADAGRSSVGDLVTLAGFHPQWEFQGMEDCAVNFEKRSPYPTVSIVLTEGIDAAGEAVTARVSKHNQEVLNGLGTSRLTQIFRDQVLCPHSTTG
eukprot:CAMPEP_0170083302 /NCGR_PEP_ID=MMETSP0019_2-20121128/18692_1 /TAXON_ID=98059 /ORGANISM="Dinobryon sp., Strain UTEXLB2267" /LENGTH=369 /DNA_ID=CAMNT_0010298641 /DNA_START=1424 /DNA_END=2533 /DNA_ORIENTATION=+